MLGRPRWRYYVGSSFRRSYSEIARETRGMRMLSAQCALRRRHRDFAIHCLAVYFTDSEVSKSVKKRTREAGPESARRGVHQVRRGGKGYKPNAILDLACQQCIVTGCSVFLIGSLVIIKHQIVQDSGQRWTTFGAREPINCDIFSIATVSVLDDGRLGSHGELVLE